MWCIILADPLYDIVAPDVDSIIDTTCFLSNNEDLARQVMEHLETLASNSSITSDLTFGVNLEEINTRFQMVHINDTSVITPGQFPYECICIDGVINALGLSKEQVHQHNTQYYNNGELNDMRNLFGEWIV